MRKSYKAEALKSGTIYGISLGADYTAEHEWGIGGIMSQLEVDDESNGIQRYTSTLKELTNAVSFTVGKKLFIIFGVTSDMTVAKKTYGGRSGHSELRLMKGFGKYKAETLATAWDKHSFGIIISKEDRELYDFGIELAKAIENGDVAVWLRGTSNPFDRSGLNVAIASKVPKELDDIMCKAHLDERKLLAASEATGILKLLAEKGKRYYACSPSWNKELITTHTVMYWLNPYEQEKYKSGWYTVEDLRDWANDVNGCKVLKVSKS